MGAAIVTNPASGLVGARRLGVDFAHFNANNVERDDRPECQRRGRRQVAEVLRTSPVLITMTIPDR